MTEMYFVIEFKTKGSDVLEKLPSEFTDYADAVVTANSMTKIRSNIEHAFIRRVTVVTDPTIGNYSFVDGNPIWNGWDKV